MTGLGYLVEKGFRLAIICGVLATTIMLGELYRPSPVQAEVYQNIRQQTLSLFKLIDRGRSSASTRRVVVNGNRMTVEYSRTGQMPSAYIDALESRTQHDYTETFLNSALPENEKNILRPFFRPFRFYDGRRQIFGRLLGGDAVQGINLLERLANGEPLGMAGAGGFVVFASPSEDDRSTQLWKIQFDESFNPLKFAGAGRGDVEGHEYPGISRYPGSRRALHVSEFSAFSEGHVIAYEGPDSVEEHREFYLKALKKSGYHLLREGEKNPDNAVLHFNGDGLELTVYVSKTNHGLNPILDMIQIRRTG